METLKKRFDENMDRHRVLEWDGIEKKILSDPKKMESLSKMESTGGEPDVIGFDKNTGEYIFCDCSPESPSGRRSLCYDRDALNGRKENKPKNSAIDMAEEMGVDLLDEKEYVSLQKLGEFDTKTQSWLKTPGEVRKLGGAIFGDRRYGRVFVFHNGADAYYAVRGFRGKLLV